MAVILQGYVRDLHSARLPIYFTP